MPSCSLCVLFALFNKSVVESILKCHTAPHFPTNGASVNIEFTTPLCNCFSLVSNGVVDVISPIVSLFFICGPATIVGLVVAVNIFSINRMH